MLWLFCRAWKLYHFAFEHIVYEGLNVWIERGGKFVVTSDALFPGKLDDDFFKLPQFADDD